MQDEQFRTKTDVNLVASDAVSAQLGQFVAVTSLTTSDEAVCVYQGTDTRTGKPLRVFLSAQPLTDFERSDFNWKMEKYSKVRHNCVAELIDSGYNESGHAFVALSDLGGIPFDEYVTTKQPVPLENVRTIFDDLVGALKAAQAGGLRDNDSSSTFVHIVEQSDGTVHAVHYGIGNLLNSKAKRRDAVGFDGARMLAPEEHLGGDSGEQSDIFVLGMLLHETMVGRKYQLSEQVLKRIRVAKDPLGVANNVNARSKLTQIPAGTYVSSIQGSLGPVLANALEVNPSERTHSLAQFQNAVLNACVRRESEMRRRRPSKVMLSNREWALISAVGICGFLALTAPTYLKPVVAWVQSLNAAPPVVSQVPYHSPGRPPRPARRTDVDPHEPGPVEFSAPAPFPFRFTYAAIADGNLQLSGITHGGIGQGAGDFPGDTSRVAARSGEQRNPYGNAIVNKDGFNIYELGTDRNPGVFAAPTNGFAGLPPLPRSFPRAMNPSNAKQVVDVSPAELRFGQARLFPNANQTFRLKGGAQFPFDTALGPGDYILEDPTQIHDLSLVPDAHGKYGLVRVFIQGEPSGTVIRFPSIRTNSHEMTGASGEPIIEVWYNGTGTVAFDGIGDYHGIMYMPRAKMRINGINKFLGSIVAHDIALGGITTLALDPTLSQVKDWNTDAIKPAFDSATPYMPYALYAKKRLQIDNGATVSGGAVGTAAGGATIMARNVQVELNSTAFSNFHMPAPSQSVQNLGAIDSDQMMTLSPGDYKVSGIRLGNGGGIKIAPGANGEYGLVRIFVDELPDAHDAINLDRAFIGTGSPPNMVQVIYTGTKDITLGSRSLINGAIMAPNSYISVAGGSIIRGAAYGKEIVVGQSGRVFFDPAFADERNRK